jgi:predicted  nucleic acid-binding Zn-ribbon protein
MTNDSSWFHKKWGIVTHKSLEDKIVELEKIVFELQEKYAGALEDIKRLEEENIETTNCIYELQNSIEAVDARIDILSVETFTKNV